MSKEKQYFEHPSYIGLVCAEENSEKEIAKYTKQYDKRGFDNTELWSLDFSIAKFILPRLKEFRKVCNGAPYGGEDCKFETTEDNFMTVQGWKDCLQKMIDAFQLIVDYDAWGDDRKQEIVEEGLDVFRKYFHNLWL